MEESAAAYMVWASRGQDAAVDRPYTVELWPEAGATVAAFNISCPPDQPPQ
jgi:hypothetical protein